MLNCRFIPIAKWPSEPTPSWKRTRGQFSASWKSTLELLERELNQLRAKAITVEGFFWQDQIRQDGWPKSNARPTQPGVVLSFDTPKGRMIFPCDTYLGWESNLRAIALTLEDLRAIERRGAVKGQQQYTGWLQLPAASPVDEALECARVIARNARDVNSDPERAAKQAVENRGYLEVLWKDAVQQTHPDRNPHLLGDATKFQAVIAARARLRELKGWL